MTEKKPFYKKWWFWSIIAIIVIAIIVPEEEDTDNQESNATEEVNATEEKPEDAKTEHDEEFQFTEFLIDGITTEVNGDELELRFYWTNQSGEDDVWFERVGWIDVSQDGELLQEVSGAYDTGSSGDALREAELGVRLPVKLIYKIQNDEPIEINFGPTLEADQNRYKITVQ